ncbi:hypothetical protein [Pseudomonas sp. 31 E 6]|uniref:hypothetical protein n=1 Tax=unclassified Pseudomonas TaxID=196821 RepID=UPI0008122365|nr:MULTISPECIES: hypothetical protein [unclassified Pseudomonas]CRM18911.1 hypothetical protein [Pseudomonas sp. 31 E 5]CRM29496.1 hypothetical protein [Pseudomonas sp. 31 E 6]
MDIAAIGKMLRMARGHERLGQDAAQGTVQRQEKIDPEVLKKLMEMLSDGAQGGGGADGQVDQERISKMMSGRQGMEALMPDSDNGRQIVS